MIQEKITDLVKLLKSFNLMALLLIIIAGAIVLLITGMPVNACLYREVLLHYTVVSAIIILLPSSYLFFMLMIKKANKSSDFLYKIRLYKIAFIVRLTVFTCLGFIAMYAYAMQPLKNFLLLIGAVILLMLLYWPKKSGIIAELNIVEFDVKEKNINEER